MSKKRKNDNPLPPEVYRYMMKFNPFTGSENFHTSNFDLHHALVDKGDVKGMPLEERKLIHNPLNLWWVLIEDHASHANIEDKRVYYKLLCARWGKSTVDDFVRSFHWKSTPPVTVEWLESEE